MAERELLTIGTWLSDKYAEGTIGHRSYAGCQNVDIVEQAAVDHAEALFGPPHAYVQPQSGIDANLVAFWAILAQRVEAPALAEVGFSHVNDPSDTDWEQLRLALGNQRALGMSLDAGGHLSHGFRPNISGKMFHQSSYGTDPVTGLVQEPIFLVNVAARFDLLASIHRSARCEGDARIRVKGLLSWDDDGVLGRQFHRLGRHFQ